MPCLEAIVADIAEAAYGDVSDAEPALHFVMVGAVEHIGHADGGGRGGGFQRGEGGVVVDDVVGDENLLPSARASGRTVGQHELSARTN